MKNIPPNKKSEYLDKNSEFLKYLIEKGGPEPQDYAEFTAFVDNIEPDLVDSLREKINSILNENTLIGHGFIKPYGYPGDFMLIDKIYQYRINEDERYKNWDIFFQQQPAANAVRNRKSFFLNYCKKLVLRKKSSKVLILGSGPATDVYEFLEGHYGQNEITIDLIDYDQCAIDFSMKKNLKFNGIISYNRINSLRFNPFKLYDLIWSAGMFDYFKEKHFIFLLKKYFNCLTEDGEMIISNFSINNPNMRSMEVLSDWYLNLRSESDLLHITSEAGIYKKMASVEKEPLGINYFLKIKKQ